MFRDDEFGLSRRPKGRCVVPLLTDYGPSILSLTVLCLIYSVFDQIGLRAVVSPLSFRLFDPQAVESRP
jgi:hypothetical protein